MPTSYNRRMRTSAPPKLLLGVTGGIAAYKAAELSRLFIKAGWQVQDDLVGPAAGALVLPALTRFAHWRRAT